MTKYVRIGTEESIHLQSKSFLLAIIVITILILLFKSKDLAHISKIEANEDCVSTSNVSKTFGFHNYTEYLRGEIPLIIAVPHGGHFLPEDLPNLSRIESNQDQDSEDYIQFNDVNTQEIARVVADQLMVEFGGRRVYMVINHLNQRKVDVNRPYEQGTEPNKTSPIDFSKSQIAWKSYHEFLKSAVDEVEARFGRGLVIDFHGHDHKKEYIEVGYLLPVHSLALPTHTLNTNSSIHNSSSIRSLYYRMIDAQITFTSLIRADVLSLGGRLQTLGYHTVPSQAHHYPMPHKSYLPDGGGYSIRTYGSSNGRKVDAVQLELPKKFRIGIEASHRFVVDLVEAITWFFKTYYWGRIGCRET